MKFDIKVILFLNQLFYYFAVFSPVCSIPFVDRVLTKLHHLIIYTKCKPTCSFLEEILHKP